jgi:hypothetical protein
MKPSDDRCGEFERWAANRADELNLSGLGGLLEQYCEMASDSQHEAEAEEWSEGLIGDVSAEQ